MKSRDDDGGTGVTTGRRMATRLNHPIRNAALPAVPGSGGVSLSGGSEARRRRSVAAAISRDGGAAEDGGCGGSRRGFGTIGRRVAKLANAYEMRVIASGRTADVGGELHGAAYLGGGAPAMHRVLEESDFVVVSTPLVEETRGLIGTAELGMMKPTAYLINPARGHIVDEVALYDALVSHQIAGAAIDTWYEYPSGASDQPRPSKMPFWDLPNVISRLI